MWHVDWHLVLDWHCRWGGSGRRVSVWGWMMVDCLRLRVTFIPCSVVHGQICLPKGP